MCTEEGTPEAPSVNKKQKLVDILAKARTSRSHCVKKEECTQDELTRYLEMPSPDMKSNPLTGGRFNKPNFRYCPIWPKIFIRICYWLCIRKFSVLLFDTVELHNALLLCNYCNVIQYVIIS